MRRRRVEDDDGLFFRWGLRKQIHKVIGGSVANVRYSLHRDFGIPLDDGEYAQVKRGHLLFSLPIQRLMD